MRTRSATRRFTCGGMNLRSASRVTTTAGWESFGARREWQSVEEIVCENVSGLTDHQRRFEKHVAKIIAVLDKCTVAQAQTQTYACTWFMMFWNSNPARSRSIFSLSSYSCGTMLFTLTWGIKSSSSGIETAIYLTPQMSYYKLIWPSWLKVRTLLNSLFLISIGSELKCIYFTL